MTRTFKLCIMALLTGCPVSAYATQTLDLTGAVSTLDINAAHMPALAASEQSWWPAPQSAKPFTSSSFAITPGLPPYGAWNATNSVAGAFWSGWSNEAGVYPNLNEMQALLGTNEAVPTSTSHGTLDLIASVMPAVASRTLPAQLSGRHILSGAFNTYPYGQEYGYFEITARVPKGNGLWPAFWMNPVAMTKISEIDVSEILSVDTTTSYSTLHTNDLVWAANPQNKPSGIGYKAPEDLSQGFHSYGVDWGPQTITFYLDKVAIKTFSTPADMHQPFFIIANLAVGLQGGWGGGADSTTPFPATYSISSIRVWQRPAYIR